MVTADVSVPPGGAEGVLYARGGHNAGHSFFVRQGLLHFDYNSLGTHYRASGPVDLGEGRHALSARFERNGPGAMLTVAADGHGVGAVEVGLIVRMPHSTGLDIGRDALSPIVDDCEAPFPFSGRIEQAVFEVDPRRSGGDAAAAARTELSKE